MSSRPSRDIYAETLTVFDRSEDPFEPLTTPEVADVLDENRRTVYKRLQKLVEREELQTKEVGSRARVWWRASTTEDQKEPEEQRERQHTSRQQELERYRALIEAIGDPVYELDTQGRFTFVNDAMVEVSGYDESELLGQYVSIGMKEDDVNRTASVIADLLTDVSRDSASVEYEVVTRDGEQIPVENHLSLLTDENGEFQGTTGVLRDVTERKERQHALEESERRYQTIVENFPNGIVTLFDEEFRYLIAGGQLYETFSRSPEETVGKTLYERNSAEEIEILEPQYRAALNGESRSIESEYAGRTLRIWTVPVTDENGDVFAGMAMLQDITELKQREEELERQIRQQEGITTLGLQALENRDVDALMADASELVADRLDNDYCKVLDLDSDAEELLLRQGVGWDEGIVGSATVSAIEEDSQAAYTLASKQPSVVEDLATEPRFSGPELLTSHDARSGISTIIGPDDNPWGILGTHDTDRKEFSDQDVNFVQSVANILATAIERHEYEQTLARQREHLATLNSLNTVVREINDAVIRQSTRKEIEQVVCEQLAASESYKFAWIAETDPYTGEVTPRAEAGIENFLESIELSSDPKKRIGRGPAGKTFQSGELQISRNVFADPAFEPWRHNAEQYGFNSFAAIPISHGGTLYGVIGIYSERVDAFAEEEQDALGQLGEVVGHAIAALRQKRALMSDDIVELTLKTRDFAEALDLSTSPDGNVSLVRTVPTSADAHLMYGTATGDGMEIIQALVEDEIVPQWESVEILRSDGAETQFEVRLVDPPVVSAVAAHGGYIHEATIEDGDLSFEIHLAPPADVARLVDTIKETYPTTKLVSQHQITRTDQPLHPLRQELADHLTERQQAALEAAYYSGFFNWPRDSSGEDIAQSLDIGSSTFHQHLRKAEKQLLDVVFAET